MNNFAEHLKEITDGKSVCILGFGREGRSTYAMLTKYCSPSCIAIADLSSIDREAAGLPDNVELICGSAYQECLDRFDVAGDHYLPRAVEISGNDYSTRLNLAYLHHFLIFQTKDSCHRAGVLLTGSLHRLRTRGH